MSSQDVDIREANLKLSAETLKQLTLTLLERNADISNPSSRRSREVHPRAAHSTRLGDSCSVRKAGCSSPSDSTPVNTLPHSLSVQVVPSPPRCAARQLSSSVDLEAAIPAIRTETTSPSPPAPRTDSDSYVIIDKPPQDRPQNLVLKRDLSRSSNSSGKTTPRPDPIECPLHSSPLPNERDFVSSYPPGPERGGGHHGTASRKPSFACNVPNLHDPSKANEILARRIAERLKVVGDEFNTDVQVNALIENLLASLSLGHELSWNYVVSLYHALSRLLSQCLENREAPDVNEPLQNFQKLWKFVLQTVIGWIADNGGWYAFIRATDYSTNACVSTSTPNCHRRFTYSYSPSDLDPGRFSTPQLQRRCLGRHNQSSPAIPSARGRERGSRVLSLTEEGLFHLEGVFNDEHQTAEEQSSEEDDRRSHDEGLFATSSSQSSFNSECGESPVISLLNTRPQSSAQLRETAGIIEGSAFDRNRSRSFPTRRRPSSASMGARRVVQSVVEDPEGFSGGQSVDSGLEASSELSIASNDSGLYTTLGVSAICIYEAVRSMLDHDEP